MARLYTSQLQKKAIWRVVTGEKKRPDEIALNPALSYRTISDYEASCERAIGEISRYVDQDNSDSIQRFTDPQLVWQHLESKHRGKATGDRFNRLALLVESKWEDNDTHISGLALFKASHKRKGSGSRIGRGEAPQDIARNVRPWPFLSV